MNKQALTLMMAGLFAAQTAMAACNSNDADYVTSSQGWVLQKSTGLIWQPCLHGMSLENGSCTGTPTAANWIGALQAAQSNTDFQSSEWRIPNVKEVASLLEFSCNTRINEAAFAGQPVNSTVWSNTLGAPVPGGTYTNAVMTVRFYDFVQPLTNSFNNSSYSYAPFITGQPPTTGLNFRLVRNATPADILGLQ
ncbi:DUF1566 domain-containing protein [Salinispirillum sp. LH 10-3-1]|uniref:DUF1566 domain-containing protein n=1 Tax=Salinispirillum sp. LH 10-3-1 TaxID=2952525 RepID=A0AB38YHB6_9GAMM